MRKAITTSIIVVLSVLTALAIQTTGADNARVINPIDGAVLIGTYSALSEVSPKAVMVLATGSGQQDRDETLLNHKPLKAIAETLVNQGYGVLRLDDRGVGASTGEVSNATTKTFTEDIRSALVWLDSVSPDTPKGILGHSEGGLIAINLAADPLCDFIITLAAPAMPGDSIILTQGRAVTEAMMGKYEAEPYQKKFLSIAKSDIPQEEAREQIMVLMSELIGPQSVLPTVKQQIEAQVDALLTPWSREFLRTDPTQTIKEVKKPWLALNGDKDFQVLPVNLELIRQLNPTADCVLLPEHNHLFLECKTGLPQEYFSLSGDISPNTLEALSIWLNKHFDKAAGKQISSGK